MEEILAVLEEIKDRLVSIDEKLDRIQGDGVYNSLTDICDKIDSVEIEIGNINL